MVSRILSLLLFIVLLGMIAAPVIAQSDGGVVAPEITLNWREIGFTVSGFLAGFLIAMWGKPRSQWDTTATSYLTMVQENRKMVEATERMFNKMNETTKEMARAASGAIVSFSKMTPWTSDDKVGELATEITDGIPVSDKRQGQQLAEAVLDAQPEALTFKSERKPLDVDGESS